MLAGFGLGVPTVSTAVVAPVPWIAVTAARYGAAVLLMTATFLPASDGDRPDAYDLPVSASSAVAASATVRVSGPGASWALATGSTPSLETSPTVGLRPTTPATPA